MKERVTFVDHSAKLGGGQLGLIRYLQQQNDFQASVLLLDPADASAWQLPEDTELRTTSLAASMRRASKVIREISAHLDGLRPDIVVCNSYSAAQYVAMSPKRGRKIVYYLRQEALPNDLPPAKRWLNKAFMFRRFDGFLANSAWTASTLPRHNRDSRPLAVAYPVSGVTDVAPARPVTQTTSRLRILSLSRLSPWKGIHVLLEAVAIAERRLPPSSLQVTVAGGDHFGEAAYGQRLQALARRTTSVEFVGHVHDVGRLLQEHDVLCNLSVTPEPFGQVIVQGLANGLAVITTEEGGPAEIFVDGVSGFKVESENAAVVADRLVLLHQDRVSLQELQHGATSAAQPFLDRRTVAGFSTALKEVTAP